VDRLTRKELKTDKFALEVGHSVEYVSEHRQQFVRYGAIAGAVIALALVVYGFVSYRTGVREDALRAALKVQEAPVGPSSADPETQTFATPEAKDAAVRKALNDVANNYSGSKQAAVAKYYLGTMEASKGDLATAEKDLRDAIANGGNDYASLAKLSLASILQAQGKAAEGEQMLRSLVDSPTTFVSKEQATIVLARYIAPSKPAEARKMLEGLRTERSAISRAALTALSEIPPAK
jgi:predicted negative regulator of RcsB-dependent stress response